jgi:hypothetical protein
VTAWLVDKSALGRLAGSPDAEEWAARISRPPETGAVARGWLRALLPC